MTFLRTRCAHCRKKLEPRQLIHPECIDGYAEAQAAKALREEAKKARAAAKVERAETKRRKEAAKSRSDWLADCQAIINRYVRLRDRDLPCCSCDRPASWGGQWHASHFRSVGAASGLRFHLWNIHKGCSICNNHLSGNIAGYRPRLIERIGLERFHWLESQNHLVRYDVEYLKRLKAVIGKKLKRMEKSLGI